MGSFKNRGKPLNLLETVATHGAFALTSASAARAEARRSTAAAATCTKPKSLLGGSIVMGVPQNGSFIVENLLEIDDLRVPPFQETSS